MPEFPTLEARLAKLEAQAAGLKKARGFDARVPLLATAFDVEAAIFPPTAHVYNSGNISINNAAETTVTFDSERKDTDNIHDTGTNTSRLTCRTAGEYSIGTGVEYANAVYTDNIVYFRVNGATYIAEQRSAGSIPIAHSISVHYDLVVGDYVEVRVYQASGDARNLVANASISPEFWMTWVGP